MTTESTNDGFAGRQTGPSSSFPENSPAQVSSRQGVSTSDRPFAASNPPRRPAGYEMEKFEDLSLDDKSDSDALSGRGLRSSSSSTIATEPEHPASRYATGNSNRSNVRSQSHNNYLPQSRATQDDNMDDVEKQHSGQEKGDEPEKDPNLIEWDGPDDKENPQNWSRAYKWFITVMVSLLTLTITFASSVFSTATAPTALEFGVSNEVMILGTSLFVLGFAVGPPIWGPLSELYGRKPPLFFGFFVFAIFQIPVAVAQNLQTIMLCRFFGGVFGSAPLGIVGGQLTDFWGPLDRGVAMVTFASATFIGPVAGPIVGGFIVQSHLGWRWTEYITAIMGFFFGGVAFLCVPETFAPVLLSKRAAKIRFATKNWAIHSKLDEQQFDPKVIAEKYLLRPFVMLLKEPILDLITIYMSVVSTHAPLLSSQLC